MTAASQPATPAPIQPTTAAPLAAKTALGFTILGVSLLLGVVYDLLLRPAPTGINLSLSVLILLGAILLVARWQRLPLTGGGRWLIPVVVGLTILLVWRDSAILRGLNFLATVGTLTLLLARLTAGRLRVAGLIDYLLAGIQAGFGAAFNPFILLFHDIDWGELRLNGRWYQTVGAAMRGLLIVIPLLLLFGGLFVAADAVFAGLLSDLLHFNLPNVFGHLILIGFCAWIVAGLLHLVCFARPWQLAAAAPPKVLTLGPIELGVILGALNILFLAFVIVQIRYLFGGEQVVLVSTTLTYAEYARRGFFELTTVSALVLPVLLGLHWLIRPDHPAARWLFRILASSLIALLVAIMASALRRMRLYQETYGLTELRIYTTAFMLWLAVLFIWFCATTLRDQRDRFPFGALVSALAALLILNVINPDAMIVKANLDLAIRPENTRPFDRDYVTALSADTVPDLIAALPRLDPASQRQIADTLLHERQFTAQDDWRTWHYSVWTARAAIAANRDLLLGIVQQR